MSVPKMKTILFVDKCGEVKDLTIKHLSEDNLYKRANTTNSDGFLAQASWVVGTETYTLYGKTSGPSNAVNKYEFPPTQSGTKLPEILYGHCLIVATSGTTEEFFDRVISTSVAKWEVIYEGLFGGFENLNESSDISDPTNPTKLGEEDAYDLKIIRQIYKEKKSTAPTMPVTIEVDSNGYIRDGFVVSDHESEPDTTKRPTKLKKAKKLSLKEPKAKEPKAKEPKAKVPKRKPVSVQAPMYCSGDTEQELTVDEYV